MIAQPSSANHQNSRPTGSGYEQQGVPPSTSRNTKGKRRNGSVSGSQRSGRIGKSTAEKETRPGNSTDRSSTQKPRRRRVSKFLSFLNCCSAQDNGNGTDNEPSPPSRDYEKSALQSAPQHDSTTEQVASTTTQPMGSIGEQRKQPEASQSESRQQLITRNEKPIGMASGPAETQPASVPEPLPEAQIPGQEKPGLDKPLPASPPETPATVAHQRPAPLDVAHPPTSTAPIQEPQIQANEIVPTPIEDSGTPVTATEEKLIEDRTLKQEATDEDIEMTDSHPDVPRTTTDDRASGEEPAVHDKESPITQVDQLPPPPSSQPQPHPAAPVPVAAPVATQANLRAGTPPEMKKALLPALRPEHSGRKCLVLDLDETLVHSSFKVSRSRHVDLLESSIDASIRFSTKQTSPFQSRLKVNIIMCM